MNPTTGVMKMHLKDGGLTWLGMPWAVLGCSFVINWLIGAVISGGEAQIKTGGIASIYMLTLIVGVTSVNVMFPFAVGLSVRRTDFFVATAATAALTNAVTASLLFLLAVVERTTGDWGVNLHFFGVLFLGTLSPLGVLAFHYVVLLHMFFLGFALAAFTRRFGPAGLFVLGLISLLVGTITMAMCGHFHWWGAIFAWFAHNYLDLAWWTIPVTGIYAAAAYVLLRKATA